MNSSAAARSARVFVGPDESGLLAAAAVRGGAELVPAAEATVIVWTAGARDGLEQLLRPGVEWVQLAAAGVDEWLDTGMIDDARAWTSARGIYGAAVAEHVMALLLAAAKRLLTAARRTRWQTLETDLLAGATVGVIGAGSIGRETFRRLAPFGPRLLGLTRSGKPVPGAHRSLGPHGLELLLRESDYVILAAPLTAETEGLVGAHELALLGAGGWLINVGRGRLVATEALVRAVREGVIAGACLDVTEPEPLPEGHPLWRCENVLITPHVANPWRRHEQALAVRVEENVRRYRAGERLAGLVEPERGY